jgi:hypothetical protein
MEESYVLNADGSYTLEYSMDMGKGFSLFTSMMPDSAKQTASYTTRKDSLISFTDDMPDSIRQKLSDREYSMLTQSQMRLNMHLAEDLLRISYLNSGRTLDDLNFFIRNFGSAIRKTGKEKDTFDKLAGSAGQLPAEQQSGGGNAFGFGEHDFNIVVTPTTFTRSIIPEKWEAKLNEDQEANELIRKMGMTMNYTTTIRFPRSVKSVDNPDVKLSADRMQITYTVDLMESIKKPAGMNFKVEY